MIESAQTRHTRVTKLRGSALLRLSDSQSSKCASLATNLAHQRQTTQPRHNFRLVCIHSECRSHPRALLFGALAGMLCARDIMIMRSGFCYQNTRRQLLA